MAAPPKGRPSIRELADGGRLLDALALCEAAISRDRLDPRTHGLKASILQELGQEAEAIEALRLSLYLDPKSVLTHFKLGNLLSRIGDDRAGQLCFRTALALMQGRLDEEVLAEAEGLTVGRFREMISAAIRAMAKEAI